MTHYHCAQHLIASILEATYIIMGLSCSHTVKYSSDTVVSLQSHCRQIFAPK